MFPVHLCDVSFLVTKREKASATSAFAVCITCYYHCFGWCLSVDHLSKVFCSFRFFILCEVIFSLPGFCVSFLSHFHAHLGSKMKKNDHLYGYEDQGYVYAWDGGYRQAPVRAPRIVVSGASTAS